MNDDILAAEMKVTPIQTMNHLSNKLNKSD